MPGVIDMENGVQNGISTNHDRDRNGPLSGNAGYASQASGAGAANGEGSGMVNNGSMAGNSSMEMGKTQWPSRMNDLPDEIQHISEGFVPLGLILSRLAQKTHNQLQAKILELAKMPVPLASLNGNSAPPGSQPDDTSPDNTMKKQKLLEFITDAHGKWTKALIMTAWSRKVPTVSKLIDLFNLMALQRFSFANNINYMMNIKRDLTFSRLPNPDLQTALQILSTGDAPWMPDFDYIEPSALTPKEQVQWVEELNTLLSLRLNLEDHDKIPYHFQDYIIDSGRVTFKVKGEFEVDLTIADEDFEKQFWFIDFRFLFKPAPAELTDTLRLFLEARVNDVLEKDGLQGCYKFLHEFVLTHKITEYVRQAFELFRGRWIDTLKIERLHRGMAIQYWTDRFTQPTREGPKSWIIMGVHSGQKPGFAASPKSTSYLTLRWFRNNKEVKDVSLAFDDANISTETLLHSVIAKHVEHILSTIHGRLKAKGRFVRREAALSLQISQTEPINSSLKMQLGYNDFVTVRIAPTDGLFTLTPQSMSMARAEKALNHSKEPTEDGHNLLEILRVRHVQIEIQRRARSMGWMTPKCPFKSEEVKALLKTREPFQLMMLKKNRWPQQWFLMLTMSLGGDKWWLVEVANHHTGPRILTAEQMQLSVGLPDFSDRFFSNLGVFCAVMISQIIDQKAMLQKQVKHFTVDAAKHSSPRCLKFPSLVIRLSDILKLRQSPGAKKVDSWARDSVTVLIRGIQKPKSRNSGIIGEASGTPGNQISGPGWADQEPLLVVVDARFQVADRAKFKLLSGKVERDVAYNPELGVFALRLEVKLGTTILETLSHRVQAIERLVDCIDAIGRSSADIKCETITLTTIVFSYSDGIGRNVSSNKTNDHRWKATLDLQHDKIKMHLEQRNPHLRFLDLINNLLNSGLGFVKVPQYLALTLPVLKGLDAVEDAWQEFDMNEQGRIEVFPDHLDWFNVRYTLPGPNKAMPRRLTLQIKLRERRGQRWWYIERREVGRSASNPEDEFKALTRQVFEAPERTWQSFVYSAACKTEDVATLLQALDGAVRLARSPARSPNLLKKGPPVKGNRAPQQQANVVVLD